MSLIKCPACGKEISAQAVSCPNCGHPLLTTKTKGVFSGAQGVGVAGAIIFTPWLWPVALYPSLVRKTLSIASATKVRTEDATEPTEQKKPLQSVATAIGAVFFIAVVIIGAVGSSGDKATRGAGAAPITSSAERAKGAVANYDGSRAQAGDQSRAQQQSAKPAYCAGTGTYRLPECGLTEKQAVEAEAAAARRR